MKIDKTAVIDMLRTTYNWRQTEVSEQDFCRKFTWGYWVRGNSLYDLLSQLSQGTGLAFESLDEISEYLVDKYEGDDDSIADEIEWIMTAYDEIESRQTSLIMG